MNVLARVSHFGGSSDLITRSALVSWLELRASAKESDDVMLKGLAKILSEQSDEERISKWSEGAVGEKLAVLIESK